MRRLGTCMFLLGIGFASALAAAEPRAFRGADGPLLAAPRAEAQICRDTAPSAAIGAEQKIWPFCLDLSCAIGGNDGCALYCIVTEDNSPGGYCVAGCCYCVHDDDEPPPMLD